MSDYELRHLREMWNKGRLENVAPRRDFVSLHRPISRREISTESVAARRGKKTQALRCGTRKTPREHVPFFSARAVRRIYGLIRRRNLAVALTSLSRRPSSQHPNLHPRVRAKALRLASRMLPASFFVLARGTCARWRGRTHSRNREYLWGIWWSGGWKDEKSLANLRRALCCSAKSRIHRECVMRLLETYVRTRWHPRPCISPFRRECCYFCEGWSR